MSDTEPPAETPNETPEPERSPFELEDETDAPARKQPRPPPAEVHDDPEPSTASGAATTHDESGIDKRTVRERLGKAAPRASDDVGPPPGWPREAFVYPARGKGPFILIATTLLLVVFDLIATSGSVQFLAWIGIPVAIALALRAQLELIADSATGRDEPRGIDGLPEISSDALKRFGIFLAIFALCVGPGVVLIIFDQVGLGAVALVLGLMEASVVALGAALRDPRLKWPWNGIGWILRNPLSCLAGGVGWCVLGLSQYAIIESYGSAFALVAFQALVLRIVAVYALMVSARVIGVMGRKWNAS